MVSFSFTPAKHTCRKTKTANNIRPYEIKTKDIIGIVFIDINANYYVGVDGNKYNIQSECYSCKGIVSIYRQATHNSIERLRYDRLSNKLEECNPLYWLPFMAGCMVKGDVIQHKITKNIMFRIIKCWYDPYNEQAKVAYNYYREHFKEINKIMLERQLNV